MLLLNQSSSVTLTGLLETFSGSASGKACCRAAMGALHKERSRPRVSGGMHGRGRLSGWVERRNSRRPGAVWSVARGRVSTVADVRAMPGVQVQRAPCSRPTSPRAARQAALGCLSLSPAPRVGPPVLCTSTPVCRAPSPPRHATWRPRQRQSRASGFFFPACAPCRPRFRYDEGWTTRSHGPRRAWRFRTPAGSPRRSPRVARATEKLGSQSGVPDPPPLSLVFESRAAGRRVGPRTRTVWVSFEARSIV